MMRTFLRTALLVGIAVVSGAGRCVPALAQSPVVTTHTRHPVAARVATPVGDVAHFTGDFELVARVSFTDTGERPTRVELSVMGQVWGRGENTAARYLAKGAFPFDRDDPGDRSVAFPVEGSFELLTFAPGKRWATRGVLRIAFAVIVGADGTVRSRVRGLSIDDCSCTRVLYALAADP